MINTSPEYKSAIKAEIEISTFEADFGFIPPGSTEGSAVFTSELASCSILSQINNGIYNMGGKWATCELNRVTLDGSIDLLDDRSQRGCFFTPFCDNAGNFKIKPKITYEMDIPYDLIGVSVFFDDKGREYATSVTLKYYNLSDILIMEQNFCNETIIGIFDLMCVAVKKIEVVVNSWNMPNRMAKVCQIIPGQIFVFNDSNVFDFDLAESISPFETSIVLPEFTIKFDNSEQRFDIVNPKGVISYLRQKMKISSRIGIKAGVGIEKVNTGEFYVYDWPNDTQEDTASLTCRPSVAFETKSYTGTGEGNQTVLQAAALIFIDIDEVYIIDNELQNVLVNKYIGEDVPRINAMAQLAVACCGYWKFQRNGSYVLKKWITPKNHTNSVNYDDMYAKPTIAQRRRYTSVNAKYYTFDSAENNLQSYDNIITQGTDDGERKEIASCFIPNAERARIVAQEALDYYNWRLNHSSAYRGDMSIEPGDAVTIQNDYADSNIVILKHTLNWDNTLSGTVEGVEYANQI